MRSTGIRPKIVDRDADYEITKLWRDRDVRGRPTTIARAMTDCERGAVERRRNELQIGCSPFAAAEQDAAVDAISMMFGGIRSLRHDDDEAAVAVVRGLLHVLKGFPLWAIQAGCDSIHRGEAMLDGKLMDKRWAPNDSEIYAVVREIVKPYLAALDNATRLLTAPVRQRL